MKKSYLAFDLGAESGRAVLGELGPNKRLTLTEIHRFPNSNINIHGHLHWDVLGLYREMLHSMSICASKHTNSPQSIAIDTWGVDFALLDKKGNLISSPFTYRDKRTDGAMEAFLNKMPREKLYGLTGIQVIFINTVFQLYSMARDKSPQLEIAADLLFIPDIFNYFFTGVKASEFTFATTSQLYNPATGSWEREIFKTLGIPKSLMQNIVMPGTALGTLTDGICAATGLKPGIPVVAAASHDTASAVAAVPAQGSNFAYISSGTWSLLGIESKKPVINEKTLRYNITNEGGAGGTFRVLKNITGLWLLQRCRNSWLKKKEYSYAGLSAAAEKAPAFKAVLDPDSRYFVDPDNMPGAIANFCRETGQQCPGNPGEFTRIIYESLALAYRFALEQMEEISSGASGTIEHIHIIGGGSQSALLCQFTADASGILVHAGPVEATAIGNILVQAMASGQVSGLDEIRDVSRNSFPVKTYKPKHDPGWDKAYEMFKELKKHEHD